MYIHVGLCRANLIIFAAPFVSLEPEAPTIDWQDGREKKGGVPVDFARGEPDSTVACQALRRFGAYTKM